VYIHRTFDRDALATHVYILALRHSNLHVPIQPVAFVQEDREGKGQSTGKAMLPLNFDRPLGWPHFSCAKTRGGAQLVIYIRRQTVYPYTSAGKRLCDLEL